MKKISIWGRGYEGAIFQVEAPRLKNATNFLYGTTAYVTDKKTGDIVPMKPKTFFTDDSDFMKGPKKPVDNIVVDAKKKLNKPKKPNSIYDSGWLD